MNRILLSIAFFMTTLLSSSAQSGRFDELTNNLLLRIRSYQSDSVTTNFIKKYAPILAIKPINGSWTAYPPDADTTPETLTVHTLIFQQHPFVNLDILEGRLNLLTKEKNGTIRGYRNYDVSFLFDTRQKAIKAFHQLCNQYDSISTSKKIILDHGKRIAVYKDDNRNKWPNQIVFILTRDELFNNRYKIIFCELIDPLLAQQYDIQQ